MVGREQGTALRHVKLLFEVGTIGSLSDRQLLEQFQSRSGDAAEAAFAILVERHGPMIIRTCRSVLQNEHAVEDAFQATFLVLVRRARSLWVRDSLGPWLFQVAVRVSASAARLGGSPPPARTTQSQPDRNPGVRPKSRRPESAHSLGACPAPATVPFRRGALLLGRPLPAASGPTARLAAGNSAKPPRPRAGATASEVNTTGHCPIGHLFAALLSSESTQAAVPAALASSTIRMAVHHASGKAGAAVATASPVILLTQGVLKTMVPDTEMRRRPRRAS